MHFWISRYWSKKVEISLRWGLFFLIASGTAWVVTGWIWLWLGPKKEPSSLEQSYLVTKTISNWGKTINAAGLVGWPTRNIAALTAGPDHESSTEMAKSLVLVGTIITHDTKNRRAIIRDANGKLSLYRLGNMVAERFTVESIEPNAITLLQQNSPVTLRLRATHFKEELSNQPTITVDTNNTECPRATKNKAVFYLYSELLETATQNTAQWETFFRSDSQGLVLRDGAKGKAITKILGLVPQDTWEEANTIPLRQPGDLTRSVFEPLQKGLLVTIKGIHNKARHEWVYANAMKCLSKTGNNG